MLVGGSHSGTARPGADTRLRLLALFTPSASVRFEGVHACVSTAPGDRVRVAGAIAAAVIGPRPPEVVGTIDIAGREVALQSLPAPLLGPSSRPTIDTSVFDELARDLGIRHVVHSPAWHAVQAHEHRGSSLVRPEVEAIVPRLITILDAIEGIQTRAALGPRVRALAEAFAALGSRGDTAVDIGLAGIERRAAAARIAVAQAAGGVLPAEKVRIESCHRLVVETERELFEATRKDRSAALEKYQRALTEERAALADAGVDSFASFLLASTAGVVPVNREVRLRAEVELAHAEAELAAANLARAADRDRHNNRELELRAHAAQLLGRFPGADPAAELRALLAAEPTSDSRLAELHDLLAGIGEDDADAVGKARALVAAHESARDAGVRDDVAPAEIAQLETRSRVGFANLDADDSVVVLGLFLDRYRAAEYLAGRLPIVLDGVCDDLAPGAVAAIARELSHIDDAQVIVVTGRRDVADAFANLGTSVVSWPPLVATPAAGVAIAAPIGAGRRRRRARA